MSLRRIKAIETLPFLFDLLFCKYHFLQVIVSSDSFLKMRISKWSPQNPCVYITPCGLLFGLPRRESATSFLLN